MKKEKQVKTYTRRTKSGKTVIVKAHTAKYDASDKRETAKRKGAGDELAKRKSVTEEPAFTADDYKAWYHWDAEDDPKNKSALKVEKALIKQMGRKAYNKYFDELTDNYSARGHLSAFKKLGMPNKPVKKETPKVSPRKEPVENSEGVTIETHYRGRLKRISSPTIMRKAPGTSLNGTKYPERFLAFNTTTGKTVVFNREKDAVNYFKGLGISKKNITLLGIK